jgi:hypothetical protein
MAQTPARGKSARVARVSKANAPLRANGGSVPFPARAGRSARSAPLLGPPSAGMAAHAGTAVAAPRLREWPRSLRSRGMDLSLRSSTHLPAPCDAARWPSGARSVPREPKGIERCRSSSGA